MPTTYASLGSVKFPAFQGTNINMLPFRMGDPESIPEEYRHYSDLIEACRLPPSELGKVGYLSVSESIVAAGASQRRPGLHTEGHPMLAWGEYSGGSWGGSPPPPASPQPKGEPKPKSEPEPEPGAWGGSWNGEGWGRAPVPRKGAALLGGLYMASTIAGSCAIWDRYVKVPGPMGDCEHLRCELGSGQLLDANELVWLTDRTPHEALPVMETTPRQWFRLVTSLVDVWYRQHSTANRLGIQPPCRIIETNKFA